ncbi:ABC transporter substrate-binding protein [Frankia sp. ACN1ag]|uniref:ABC transporter substrate-binding protein n=1 Tax=Frankia sp. ACN1ag TaxID=102891 RepID=UPI000FF87F86|nr:ABC transporter substrate-binding protein [Frankia sp. ACN1ag]
MGTSQSSRGLPPCPKSKIRPLWRECAPPEHFREVQDPGRVALSTAAADSRPCHRAAEVMSVDTRKGRVVGSFRRRGWSILAVGMAVGLAACGSSGSGGSPATSASASPAAPKQRVATDNPIAMETLIAVGEKPACSLWASPKYVPLLAKYLDGIIDLGQRVDGTVFNIDALAKCRPDVILMGAEDPDVMTTIGKVGKVVEFVQPNPPISADGSAGSTWRNWLHAAASPVGATEKAHAITATVDLQEGALKGLLRGKSLAVVETESTSAYEVVNKYLPLAWTYVRDLGIENYQATAADYDAGCLDDKKPKPCYSTDLSMETLPALSGVDGVLVQSAGMSSSDLDVFKANPLFANLPAVKSGHVSVAKSFTDTGPIGVSFLLDEIADAFHVKEFHAALGSGGRAHLAVDPAANKLCWSVSPTPGTSKPDGTIKIAAGGTTVKLADKATFAPAETEYQTTPPTVFSTGCAPVAPKLAQALMASPADAKLTAVGGSGSLVPGAASVVVG